MYLDVGTFQRWQTLFLFKLRWKVLQFCSVLHTCSDPLCLSLVFEGLVDALLVLLVVGPPALLLLVTKVLAVPRMVITEDIARA
jgi:hypothetical protein